MRYWRRSLPSFRTSTETYKTTNSTSRPRKNTKKPPSRSKKTKSPSSLSDTKKMKPNGKRTSASWPPRFKTSTLLSTKQNATPINKSKHYKPRPATTSKRWSKQTAQSTLWPRDWPCLSLTGKCLQAIPVLEFRIYWWKFQKCLPI